MTLQAVQSLSSRGSLLHLPVSTGIEWELSLRRVNLKCVLKKSSGARFGLTLRRATSETSTVGIGGGHMPPPLEISGLVSPPGLKFGPVIDLHDRR